MSCRCRHSSCLWAGAGIVAVLAGLLGVVGGKHPPAFGAAGDTQAAAGLAAARSQVDSASVQREAYVTLVTVSRVNQRVCELSCP